MPPLARNETQGRGPQHGYVYDRTEPLGRHFAPDFRPELTPKQMLQLGVFGGKYLTDCRREFPASWFARAKLSPARRDARLNYFRVNASQSLAVWRRNGWISSAAGSSGRRCSTGPTTAARSET